MHRFIKPFIVLLIVFSLLAAGALLAPATRVEAQADLLTSNKEFSWARGMGGTGWDHGSRTDEDANGNVYVIGSFENTVDFDPGAGTFNLTSMGSTDVFVSKLDGKGNLLWAKQIGGPGDDYGVSLYVSPAGELYITGDFSATADFDPGAGTLNLTSAGDVDIYIARYTSSGELVWAKAMGGTAEDAGVEVFTDANNNVIFVGLFGDTVDFDPGAGMFNMTSAGIEDIFVCKLDASGNFIWAKGMGGTLWDAAYSMGIDSTGNIYITGYYEDTVDFDPGAGTFNLTSAGDMDIFVSKLDNNGNFVWAKSMGGMAWDHGFTLTVDASNNLYITGYFYSGYADFDPGPGTFILTNAGEEDIFLFKLDSNGAFLWAKDFGGTDSDVGYSVAVDSNANVYTTGNFRGTVDFDPGAGTFNLTSVGEADIFVSKLDNNGNFLWATSFGGVTSDTGFSIDLDASDNIYLTGKYTDTVDFDPGPGTSNLTSAGAQDVFISKFGKAATFADVPTSHMFWKEIEAFYKAGITTGCSQTPLKYCPNALVTRGEMAVFLERAMGNFAPDPNPIGMFTDVPYPGQPLAFKPFIEEFYNDGITTGCATNPLRYCPQNYVTRQEMAVFIERALGNINPDPSPSGIFSDVPAPGAPAVFTSFIDQFYNDGITTGCAQNPLRFCPLNNVTRQEMAVFIVRAFHIPMP